MTELFSSKCEEKSPLGPNCKPQSLVYAECVLSADVHNDSFSGQINQAV